MIKAGRDLLKSSIDLVSAKIAHLHLSNDIMKEEVDERINATLDSLDELEPHLATDFPNYEIKLFHPSLFMKREVYTPLDPVEKFQSVEEVIETNDMAKAITKNISDFMTQPDSPHLTLSLDKHSGSGSFSPFEAVEDDRSAKTPPHSSSQSQEMTSRDSSEKKSKRSKKREEKTQTTSKTSKTNKTPKKASKKKKVSKTRTGKIKKIKKKVKKVLKGEKKSKETKKNKKSKELKKKKDEEEKTEKTSEGVEPKKEEK
ncbi:hypothetical protein PENTCL1PPCAC_27059, partial [Pristionchus entomophagus]